MPYTFPPERPTVTVDLDDGSTALLSPISPEDRELLMEGMGGLSPESRFLRFGGGRSRLTESELRYLTEVDQRSHVAWGALVEGEPAGVARYIVEPESHLGEVAVTVVDRLQGRGLGSRLFRALAAVARFDGLEGFTFSVQPGNQAVMRMLQGVDVSLGPGDEMLSGVIPLSDLAPTEDDGDYVAVMRRFRSGVSSLRGRATPS